MLQNMHAQYSFTVQGTNSFFFLLQIIIFILHELHVCIRQIPRYLSFVNITVITYIHVRMIKVDFFFNRNLALCLNMYV